MNNGETVRIRPGTKFDDQMNPVTAPGVGFPIPGCDIEALGNEEATTDAARTGTVTRIRIFAPGPVPRPITATDVVDARGHTWDIDGNPEDWFDSDPRLAGPVITASRSVG